MSAAHTPGPWRWELNLTSKSVYLVGGKPRYDKTVMQFGRWGMHHAVPLFNSQITGNKYNVMERLCDKVEWARPFAGLEHHSSWRLDVTHPDAVLMAAAPELLAALERLVLEIDGIEYSGDHPVAVARAAIAKATGAKA